MGQPSLGVWVAEFRLLGPVEIWTAGQQLDAGQPRQCSVLAALLVDAGRLVTLQTLIDRVWGETPLTGARQSLYSHVARIRRVLAQAGEERLERRSGGYRLAIDPDRVDLLLFRRLVHAARDPGPSDADRAAVLREALGLWRGEPLAGLSGQWVGRMRDEWRRQYVDAVLLWAQVEVRLGHASVVIERLSELHNEYPLVEPLAATLINALHEAGHTAQALDTYSAMRLRLLDELGADPGAELQAVQRAILRAGLIQPVVTRARTAAPPMDIPAQLPLDVAGFAGREAELNRLDRVMNGGGSALPIGVIVGTAGVGKTALAVHWAHLVAGRFPDGQLYVNLRGFDPGAATASTEAVRGLLDAFGVPPQRIPATLDAQAGLYRSLMAGRRVLVVLDNARDEDQVRPLLPGTPECMVVVTSRNELSGLVSAEGAHPLTLDVLAPDEARQLLANRLGPDPVAAEPEAVDDIIRQCARLPLALVIAAARGATRPHLSLAELAVQLFDAFAGRDAATNVRTVFSWSYHDLSPTAARLFRRLSIHPGPDLGIAAAACLAGVPVRRTRVLMAELTSTHLVDEHMPGRFAFHDLLRGYASELAEEHDADDDRRAGLCRLLDHYLHTAFAADRLLHPRRDPIAPAVAEPTAGFDGADAKAWFVAEHRVLLRVIGRAAWAGFDAHVWQLAWALETFLNRGGHWHDWADTQHAALRAARRLVDRGAEANAHRGIAGAYIWLGRYEEAHSHLRAALRLLEPGPGQANIHLDIAWMFERQGQHRNALDSAGRALELYRAAAHQAGEARALNAIGWSHALLGDDDQAIAFCEQALAVLQQIGDRSGEAYTWDSLGYAHFHRGDSRAAIGCYERAIGIFRSLGERYYEADTLVRLGDTHRGAGDPDAARSAWLSALDILEQLNHPDAKALHAKLQDLANGA
ncbi:MAG TPA: tetratricopeptide repeat protein [Candidatus Limnocylindrales bacterium]|nr:tetratricopeptide repeat protein [Candidatus Limnocylindrales bacterium]